MPELPEVETTLRGIAPALRGERITHVVVREPRLRWPVSLPDNLAGQRIVRIARRAKYLLLHLEAGVLILHLGMSGRLRVVSNNAPVGKHDHVDIAFGGRLLRFTDPRRFGSLHWQPHPGESHWLLKDLGVEPLAAEFDGALLFTRTRRRRVAIKGLLMDARVVVGVGNIYANEALFKAGVRPRRAAGRVSRAECDAIAAAVKDILSAAIKLGGTTLRDYVGTDGAPGYFVAQLLVYGRDGQPCTVCGTVLKGTRLGQRATVYCPRCQR